MPIRRKYWTWIAYVVTVVLLNGGGYAAGQEDQVADPTDRKSASWKMTRLDLHITLSPDTNTLHGKGTMRLALNGPPSSGPTLHLGKASRFVSVTLEDPAAGTAQISPQVARIRFPSPQGTGSILTVAFQFEGGGTGCPVAVTPQSAYVRCDGGWYPAPLDGDHAAPGSMTIVVPDGWRTVSNGTQLTSIVEGERRAERWVIEKPAARSLVAGLTENVDKARRCSTLVDKILAALEHRFGPYPYDALALVEIPDELAAWHAASDNGLVFIASKWIRRSECKLPLIAHELAHAWWGNHLRARSPGSLMIDEGMAQYGAALAIESIEGYDEALRFLRFARQGTSPCKSARGYFSHFYGQEDDKPLMCLTGEDQDYLLASAKGPWVYHMLRQEMGDELFFRTLRGIVADRGGHEVSLADIHAMLLKAKPGDDRFSSFVAQWLDRPGAPVLDVSWSPVPGRDNAAKITVRQRGATYTLPLDICVTAGNDCRIHRVHLAKTKQTYVLDGPGRPTDVTLDPDHRLLRWDPEYGE